MSLLSLPTDSDARKRIPLIDGLWGYFPAALVGVAQHSFKSNEKHNKTAPLHWSIDKSTDHAECCGRHMLDLQELVALYENGGYTPGETATDEVITSIIDEANAHAWRALALSQMLHMRFRGAPLPFNAKRSEPEPVERKDPALMSERDVRDALQLYGYPGSLRHADGTPAYMPCATVPMQNKERGA